MKTETSLNDTASSIGISNRDFEGMRRGLVAAIRESICKYTIHNVISFIEVHAFKMLAEEEEAMLRSDFPQSRAHIVAHDTLRADVLRLKRELNDANPKRRNCLYGLSVETNRIMSDWHRIHMTTYDEKLMSFLARERRNLT